MKTNKELNQTASHLSLLALWLVCFIPHAALANTLTVTSFADNLGNPFTLRTAVATANANPNVSYTILFSDALNGFTITLLNGEIPVNNNNLTIVGPDDASITIVGGNVNSPLNKRIFHVTSPGNGNGLRTFSVSGLQMQGSITAANGANGTANSPTGGPGADPAAVLDHGGGGAIYCEDNTLLVASNCYFFNCQARAGNGGDAYGASCFAPSTGGGGGSADGGAIFCAGDCFLLSCSFYTNTATGGTGGAGAQGGKGGGGGVGTGGAVAVGYHGGIDLKIVNCTFYGNIAYGGDGGVGGLGYSCVTEANPANGGTGGDGGAAIGGAIYVNELDIPATGMVHSTVYNNYCSPGGGGAGGLGIFGGVNGTAGVANAAYGCGLRNVGAGALTAGNNLIAGNHAMPATALIFGPDANGTLASLGYNLVGADDGTCLGLVASDQKGAVGNPIQALLGPFQYNGGDLPTLAPQEGSPAIDAGTDGGFPFDEIGQMRRVKAALLVPPNGGDWSDIGAFEVQCGTTTIATPVLNLVVSANNVTVTWPAPSFCYKLQTSPDLMNWSDYPGTVGVVGALNQVVFNVQGNAMFFRLAGL